MMRHLPLLALLATPLAAQEPTDTHRERAYEAGRPDATVILLPATTSLPPRVQFHNQLTSRGQWDEDFTAFWLELPGVKVRVILTYGGNTVPDLMQVIPPPGYVAYPAEVLVEEGAVGEIRLFEEGLS